MFPKKIILIPDSIFFYQNLRDILTMNYFLFNVFINVSYDIIWLCETWLNNNVFNIEIGYNNKNLYRDYRNLSRGMKHDGCVLIALNKKICCE